MWNKWINWTERKICICHPFHSLCFHFHFQCPHTEFFYKDGYWTSLSSSKITLPIHFLWCSLRFIIFSYNFVWLTSFFLVIQLLPNYIRLSDLHCPVSKFTYCLLCLLKSVLYIFFLRLVHFNFVCTFKWQN